MNTMSKVVLFLSALTFCLSAAVLVLESLSVFKGKN